MQHRAPGHARSCVLRTVDAPAKKRPQPKGENQSKLLGAIQQWQRTSNLDVVSDHEIRSIAKALGLPRNRLREAAESLEKYGWLKSTMGGFRIVPEKM
jgi:NADH:ubiquinone oxidoreductase subunit E